MFDPLKPYPEFIWIFDEWNHDHNAVSQPRLTIDTILGSRAYHVQVGGNDRLKKTHKSILGIAWRENWHMDGSRPNKSVEAILKTQLGGFFPWKGPIIAYSRTKGDHRQWCRDFDMSDFRTLVDHFLSKSRIDPPPTARAGVNQVQGVRINCVGDVELLKRPHFEAVEISAIDPIFNGDSTSDIADRVEFAVTRRCAPDPTWAESSRERFNGVNPFDNLDATLLHQCCDPSAKPSYATRSFGWGFSHESWQDKVGSVLVVRLNKQPLLPMHVEALARYCWYEVRPILYHSLGTYAPEESIKKEDALKMICRPMFVIYWGNFVKEKECYTTPSPYRYEA